MKKFLLIPSLIFPYTVCLCIGYGYLGSFGDTAIKVFGVLSLVTLAVAFVCNLIYIFTTKEKGAEQLLKTAFLIKAVHIPTYILIFILGVIMGLMFFMTLPFIIFLVLIDLFTLWISGMISVYAIAKALKEGGICSKPLLIVSLICQSFFCADVISLLVVKIAAKRNKKSEN